MLFVCRMMACGPALLPWQPTTKTSTQQKWPTPRSRRWADLVFASLKGWLGVCVAQGLTWCLCCSRADLRVCVLLNDCLCIYTVLHLCHLQSFWLATVLLSGTIMCFVVFVVVLVLLWSTSSQNEMECLRNCLYCCYYYKKLLFLFILFYVISVFSWFA